MTKQTIELKPGLTFVDESVPERPLFEILKVEVSIGGVIRNTGAVVHYRRLGSNEKYTIAASGLDAAYRMGNIQFVDAETMEAQS
jgi:hypothetical protein